MCGIAGIVRYDRPATASADTLRAVQARLRHRGPDGSGEAFGSFAALAHTRLAMVGVSDGAQPFRSADGRYLLVYNGELYNDAELRSRLGHPSQTRSDTETVLAAWEAWGEDCLPRLDGMFAFFIWDELKQVGFAVRDRLGVKPLAYFAERGVFAFASEAQAVLRFQSGPPRANVEAIVEYLVAPAFSGVARSPFSGVSYLEPGSVLRVGREGISVRSWWRWEPRPEPDADPQALAAELRGALEAVVRSSLRSDQPLGVFSSGGIDSAAVAALARPALGRMPAFTITFDGQEQWTDRTSALVVSNDTPHAREVAAALDLEPVEVPFDRNALGAELRALARVNDALPAWEQELSQRALAKAAAGRVKGVLVGDAADETHFGYHFLLDEACLASPEAILAKLGAAPVRPDVDPAPIARLTRDYREIIGRRKESTVTKTDSESVNVTLDPETWAERVADTTQLIVRRWLPRLLHNGDIHCMAFGLEARVPFVSREVLEVAARVPPALGLKGGVEKWLLREALRGVVPERTRLRRKSALPKDQSAGPCYQQELGRVLEEPHPVVSALVDVPALWPWLSGPLDERERAAVFRVVCLHHWAVAHEVRAP